MVLTPTERHRVTAVRTRQRKLKVMKWDPARSIVKHLTPPAVARFHRKNAVLKVTIKCKQVFFQVQHTYRHMHAHAHTYTPNGLSLT